MTDSRYWATLSTTEGMYQQETELIKSPPVSLKSCSVLILNTKYPQTTHPSSTQKGQPPCQGNSMTLHTDVTFSAHWLQPILWILDLLFKHMKSYMKMHINRWLRIYAYALLIYFCLESKIIALHLCKNTQKRPSDTNMISLKFKGQNGSSSISRNLSNVIRWHIQSHSAHTQRERISSHRCAGWFQMVVRFPSCPWWPTVHTDT